MWEMDKIIKIKDTFGIETGHILSILSIPFASIWMVINLREPYVQIYIFGDRSFWRGWVRSCRRALKLSITFGWWGRRVTWRRIVTSTKHPAINGVIAPIIITICWIRSVAGGAGVAGGKTVLHCVSAFGREDLLQTRVSCLISEISQCHVTVTWPFSGTEWPSLPNQFLLHCGRKFVEILPFTSTTICYASPQLTLCLLDQC